MLLFYINTHKHMHVEIVEIVEIICTNVILYLFKGVFLIY
jgi:hypothetical protein